jgi:hypothetical protein
LRLREIADLDAEGTAHSRLRSSERKSVKDVVRPSSH